MLLSMIVVQSEQHFREVRAMSASLAYTGYLRPAADELEAKTVTSQR